MGKYQDLMVRVATHNVGNPFTNRNDKAVTYPIREVRVIKDGWYGPNGLPVRLGDYMKFPLPDALNAVALGRAEFVR